MIIIHAYMTVFQSTLPRGERRKQRGHTQQPEPISIHAPARGATCTIWFFAPSMPISIHAPARGATKHFCTTYNADYDFNPRSREGSDGIAAWVGDSGIQFQSTLPRGERRSPRMDQLYCVFISIHAPARGATRKVGTGAYLIDISIHAPARGATHYKLSVVAVFIISIHAPARGATWTPCDPGQVATDFNPRSREGSDAYCRR